ncbi:hypothetical protein MCM1_2172 [Methanosarcina barkeri CM1]|uniref:Uncharacterized protein n=1 Tax=Methanosarcina barkeri CM1 TaxID=796385 RepID=A0A0G3CB18_METBA|nr:hypothetical protein MCM1_2172 [Methanosarcina barkeri CM1]
MAFGIGSTCIYIEFVIFLRRFSAWFLLLSVRVIGKQRVKSKFAYISRPNQNWRSYSILKSRTRKFKNLFAANMAVFLVAVFLAKKQKAAGGT